jgi:hypothetical protein
VSSRNGNRRSTTARGYGHHHQQTRKAFEAAVATGTVRCARCNQSIRPGERWDLGHVDGSAKQLYSGPEHERCNRATASRKDGRKLHWSRIWWAPVARNVVLAPDLAENAVWEDE